MLMAVVISLGVPLLIDSSVNRFLCCPLIRNMMFTNTVRSLLYTHLPVNVAICDDLLQESIFNVVIVSC